MNCNEVFNVLLKINQGDGSVSEGSVRELMSLGLISEVKIENGTQNGEKLTSLQKLVEERKSLLKKVTDGDINEFQKNEQTKARMAFLDEKIRGVRKEILTMSLRTGPEDSIRLESGTHVQITYLGRNAIHQMESRLNRVLNMDYAAFQNQMDDLCESLGQKTEQAERILKELTRSLKDMDETSLRSVAISLSYIPMEPAPVADRYRDYLSNLKEKVLSSNLLTVAEILFLESFSRKGNFDATNEVMEFRNLKEIIWGSQFGRYSTTEIVEKVAIIVYSSPNDKWQDILNTADSLRLKDAQLNYISLIILAMDCVEDRNLDEVYARYREVLTAISKTVGKTDTNEIETTPTIPEIVNDQIIDTINKEESSRLDRETAAAIMASSDISTETLLRKYADALKFLDSLFLNRMYTATAMISIMSQGVNETIDNIRTASAQAMKSKMSLSGLENFSLGLKLIILSTNFRTSKVPQEVLSMSILLPAVAGAPFIVIHDQMIHQHAVRRFRFHPVHSHYVYG